MNNPSKPHEAKNFSEQVGLWYQEIISLPEGNENTNPEDYRAVATRITCSMGNDNFDQWYQNGEGEPWFVEAFNLASTLELPPGFNIQAEERDEAWRRLKALAKALNEKYLEGSEDAGQTLEGTKNFHESLDSYDRQ